jgi:hypothetical protein
MLRNSIHRRKQRKKYDSLSKKCDDLISKYGSYEVLCEHRQLFRITKDIRYKQAN